MLKTTANLPLNSSYVSSNNKNITDMNDGSYKERTQLKISFIENDECQRYNYLLDLEGTVKINKEIISDLLKGSTSEFKTATEKLNKENEELLERNKELYNDLEATQGKLLIANQIVNEYQKKDEEYEIERRSKIENLLRELTKKERMLQNYRRKCDVLTEFLIKYSKQNPELQNGLKLWKITLNDSVTEFDNVYEDVELNNKLAACQKEIKTLKNKLKDCINERDRQTKTIDEMKNVIFIEDIQCETLKPKQIHPRVPSLDFSRIKNNTSSQYIHLLEETIKTKNVEILELNIKIEGLNEKLVKYENDLAKMLQINKKLTTALQITSTKLDKIKIKSNQRSKLKFKTLLNKVSEDESPYTSSTTYKSEKKTNLIRTHKKIMASCDIAHE